MRKFVTCHLISDLKRGCCVILKLPSSESSNQFLKDEIKLQDTNTYDKGAVKPGVKILIIQIEENVMSTDGMNSHNCHMQFVGGGRLAPPYPGSRTSSCPSR